MSCIFKCDRCGKIISDSEFIKMIPNDKKDHSEEMARYAGYSRITVLDSDRKCDLCAGCKMELYDWMYDGWRRQND